MPNNLRRKRHSIPAFLSVGLLALTCSSCSRLSSKQKHIRAADHYFALGQYQEAEIEYKNVLQAEAMNPQAVARLGLIYYDQGSLGKAYPYLVKAHELQPENSAVRLKLGMIDRSSGKIAEARNEALGVLERDSLNQDALLLLVETSAKPAEAEDARRRLRQLALSSPENSSVTLAMGELEFRQRDLKNAEKDIRRALAIDPKSCEANSALGALFVAKGDPRQADEALSTAADLAPARSPIKLQYAQFKTQSNDLEGARHVLEKITKETPDYLPAWLMLAEIDAGQRKFDEGEAIVAKILARDPVNPEALLLGPQIKLAKGERGTAIIDLERAQRVYPHSALVYYRLGQAYLASGDIAKAQSNLVQALNIAPEYVDAVALLAETKIRNGDFDSASVSLTKLVQQHPKFARAWLLLADANRGRGDLEGALAVYRQMDGLFPRNPETSLFMGLILLEQNKRDEARQSFSKALEFSPQYMPAVEQLINIDLAEKLYPAALKRAEDEVEKHPKQALPQMLLAKVYVAQSDSAKAETALLRAIELEPDSPTAYLLLARLYEATHRQHEALSDLQKVVAKNPNDIGALMMIAFIYDQQKDYPSARDTYEKILSANPRFSSALNNLAYLYSERLGQTDKGFEMAQKARELLPNEPHVMDTLGWILYKRHQYPWALTLLQESASKLPNDADAQFHLGMTRYLMGQEEPARAALQRALQLQSGFEGSDEARRRLAVLSMDPDVPGPAAREALEKSLANLPNDPVALARLAAVHDREGEVDKAISDYQTALAANPANLKVRLALVRLYMKEHKTKEALEMAKQARKLEPDDPEITLLLGQVAYQTGDYQWAFSLLQESARSQPENAETLFGLAMASYSIGKVADAEAAMRHAVQVGVPAADAGEAARFLDLMALSTHPDQALAQAPKIDEMLRSDPGYAPALVVRAEVEELKNNPAGATEAYEKVLGKYPDFLPAKRRLSILYSEDPAKDRETAELGAQAREAYPGDAELAKALGIVSYRQKDFQRAASLFEESAASLGSDPELMYYMGLTQYELRNQAASKRALQRALQLGLKENMAADARRIIAELK